LSDAPSPSGRTACLLTADSVSQPHVTPIRIRIIHTRYSAPSKPRNRDAPCGAPKGEKRGVLASCIHSPSWGPGRQWCLAAARSVCARCVCCTGWCGCCYAPVVRGGTLRSRAHALRAPRVLLLRAAPSASCWRAPSPSPSPWARPRPAPPCGPKAARSRARGTRRAR
jgi:hypothetical protein